ncbi:hypothetical protein [Paenibacillus sp. B1-33]|uniref:hypothetical protein n=1 Tax=unclassified Paenibacillus TaxID=185978 RepID=UPI003D29C829
MSLFQIIFIFIATPLAIVVDWIRYFVYKRKLMKPFRRIVVSPQETILGYKKISVLYASYKKLPPEIYKIVKMDLKSKEFKTPFLQIVDLFAKLVLTIGVALISFSMTLSGTLLGFAKNDKNTNPELIDKWIQTATKIIDNFKSRLDAYWYTFLIGACIFLIATVDLIVVYFQELELKKHLQIIEEIDSEEN